MIPHVASVDVPVAHRDALVAARRRSHGATLEHGVRELYPEVAASTIARLDALLQRHVAERPAHLIARDLLREAEPDWFQQPSMVGYVAYADRFAGTLTGVRSHLDYLQELGVTYLHLMPLLLVYLFQGR